MWGYNRAVSARNSVTVFRWEWGARHASSGCGDEDEDGAMRAG
jgi:hypothetical protein